MNMNPPSCMSHGYFQNSHELMGVYLLCNMLKSYEKVRAAFKEYDLYNKTDVRFICEMFAGKIYDKNKYVGRDTDSHKQFLYQVN